MTQPTNHGLKQKSTNNCSPTLHTVQKGIMTKFPSPGATNSPHQTWQSPFTERDKTPFTGCDKAPFTGFDKTPSPGVTKHPYRVWQSSLTEHDKTPFTGCDKAPSTGVTKPPSLGVWSTVVLTFQQHGNQRSLVAGLDLRNDQVPIGHHTTDRLTPPEYALW